MKTKLFALLLMLVIALPALSAQAESPEEFVTIFGGTTPEFDPHRSIYSTEAQIFTALYEGLFSYDGATLEPLAAAASSWKKSKDGMVYTFQIREDAAWSDGAPLLASDFRNSWIRMLDLNAQYAAFFDIISGAREYRTKENTNPESVGIQATGRKTLVVTLNRPAAYFTRLLCHHAFAPIHPSMLGASDWVKRVPFPVNGPYRFASFEKGRLSLEKNPLYWDEKSVSIHGQVMLFSDDDAAATRMFNNEEAHWLAGPGDYDAILMEDAIQVNPIFSTHYWYFDCSKAPWDKASVRRALALLLPWKELRDSAKYMVLATTLVLPLPGYSQAKGIESQDRDEALKLLESAGYPEGAGLPELNIYFAEGQDNKRQAMLFQAVWKALPSLKVTLAPVSPLKYYGIITGNQKAEGITLAHTTWIGDFADPEAFLQMWTPDSPLNDSGFKDAEFQTLLSKSYEKEGKERMSLLAEAETYLLQKAVVLPIYHGFEASVIDIDYIEGWYQNALSIHPYKSLKFGTPSIQPNVASAGPGKTGAALLSATAAVSTAAPAL
ncbi:MAG TPA: peptide ABC transporter substrate-binding protein [Rectinemataceae bacterium]|nr:peptide ABC transporter substrate-binding protein [Rectinemataceae bacterium]